MKGELTITLTIPNLDRTLALARIWEKANGYKYDADEVDALLADFLLRDGINDYSINNLDLTMEGK